jgi:hypothetical protein
MVGSLFCVFLVSNTVDFLLVPGASCRNGVKVDSLTSDHVKSVQPPFPIEENM